MDYQERGQMKTSVIFFIFHLSPHFHIQPMAVGEWDKNQAEGHGDGGDS